MMYFLDGHYPKYMGGFLPSTQAQGHTKIAICLATEIAHCLRHMSKNTLGIRSSTDAATPRVYPLWSWELSLRFVATQQ